LRGYFPYGGSLNGSAAGDGHINEGAADRFRSGAGGSLRSPG
jgi:hypothetical protein